MSQTIKIHADLIEESDGSVVIQTHDTMFKILTDCVIGIATSENPLCKYTHIITLKNTAEIATLKGLNTSQYIVRNVFHNLPADSSRNNKPESDCITVCGFCICTPQDCDCDCL